MLLRSVALVTLASLALFVSGCGGGGGGSGGATSPAPKTFTIGGTLTGLASGVTVTLSNNETDKLTTSASGAFTFPTAVTQNGSYSVTVATQPTGQTCVVSNGTGSGVVANVTSVSVTCSNATYTIGGTVSGLVSSKMVTLANNGVDLLTVGNGSFTFATPVAYNGNYSVTVATQPAGQTCTVANASGVGLSENVTTVSVTCLSPFSASAVLLPDLAPYLQNLCSPGIYPYLSSVTSVDVNGDNKKDLLVVVMCNAASGTQVSGPTPNKLFILEQAADGSFSIANQIYFGSVDFSLGGNPLPPLVVDLNHDGHPDFVFAVNREDGRAVENNGTNQMWYPTVLLSSGGTYSVQEFGALNWASTVALADNDIGDVDMLFNGFGAVGIQAFRLVGGVFVSVAGYPTNLQPFTIKFLPRPAPASSSQYFFAGGVGELDLYKNASGAWSMINSYQLPLVAQNVPYVTWQGTQTTADLYSVYGYNLIGTAFDASCVIRATPQQGYVAILDLGASVLSAPYSGGTVYQSNTKPFDTLMAFGFGGDQLTYYPNFFDVPYAEPYSNSEKLACLDANSDGYDDVVAYPARPGGLPEIYLNNRSGTLVHYATDAMPTAPNYYGDAAAWLDDMDGDGIVDLLYYPKNFDQNGQMIIRLHKGQALMVP